MLAEQKLFVIPNQARTVLKAGRAKTVVELDDKGRVRIDAFGESGELVVQYTSDDALIPGLVGVAKMTDVRPGSLTWPPFQRVMVQQ